MEELFKRFIRDIKDFPKPGVIFKDITPLIKESKIFKKAIDKMCENFKNEKIDKVVSMESRGFIFGAAMAYKLGAGFVPVRKKGKLPYHTESVEYTLEYGKDILEIHKDSISKDENVLIVDDVLATGGTAEAVARLVRKLGGNIVGAAFLIELTFLNGRKKLHDIPKVVALIKY
jgi:adenine phosphoribosyltransferase